MKFVLCLLLLCAAALCVERGQLQHIVLFKYKETTTQDQKFKMMKGLVNLKDRCTKPDGKKYILAASAGLQNSGEKFDKGLEQGFVLTFSNSYDRDYFVGLNKTAPYDRVHQDYIKEVSQLVSDVLVFDFNVLLN
ncbi:hypothetical protein AKO1_000433 [Acrasis kona]|uniref:Stress-response A/B barrel domain-containing protein n=1 Tax=Acrasis kona TaxID=1008807 RepID=A0AAW2YNG1_9EUKA